MLKKRTVFILGAGASMSYGLPSGAGLLAAARKLGLPQLATRVGQVGSPHSDKPAHDLHVALSETLATSLDSLLERRPELELAGKRVMAGLLLEQENLALRNKFQSDDDWLRLLFAELSSGAETIEQFVENPLIIVTFNYDRIVEYRLAAGLCARYGCGRERVLQLLEKMPVIHLHGDLGSLQGDSKINLGALSINGDIDSNYVRTVTASSERIQIVHTVNADTEEFRRARIALREAGQIILLGFGFGETNLSRLQVVKWSASSPIVGTAFGLTRAERQYLAVAPLSVRESASKHVRLEDVQSARLLREYFGMFRDGLGFGDFKMRALETGKSA
jgi:hypothetical protein